jgi:hypothetical protein
VSLPCSRVHSFIPIYRTPATRPDAACQSPCFGSRQDSRIHSITSLPSAAQLAAASQTEEGEKNGLHHFPISTDVDICLLCASAGSLYRPLASLDQAELRVTQSSDPRHRGSTPSNAAAVFFSQRIG